MSFTPPAPNASPAADAMMSAAAAPGLPPQAGPPASGGGSDARARSTPPGTRASSPGSSSARGNPYGPCGSGPSPTRQRRGLDEDRDTGDALPEFNCGVTDHHFSSATTTQAESSSFANMLQGSLSIHFRALEMRLAEVKEERRADSNLRGEVQFGIQQLRTEVFQEIGNLKTNFAVLSSSIPTCRT